MKIVIFISLKVAEISTLWFIPYYLGKWNPFNLRDGFPAETMLQLWVLGLGTVFFSLVAVFFLCLAMHENWKWATKLTKRG